MHINVNVEGLDAVDLTTVVGDEIAYYDPETEEMEHRPRTLGDLVAEKLADKIYAGLDHERRYELIQTATSERIKLIRERLVAQVEEALTGEIQKTNSYGERTGGTVTMRELVIAEVGTVINGKNDRFSNTAPLLAQVVNREVTRALRGELDQIFAAEKDKVVAAVRAQAADLIADAVKKGLGR
jgi:hypothetical protein